MESMELNSFVTKFNYLWKSGQDAHLNIHTYAGNAWVGLSLNLGHFPTGPVHINSSPRKQDSPSRRRRRERRAAARETQNDNTNVSVTEDLTPFLATEEVANTEDVVVDDVEDRGAEVLKDETTGEVINEEAASCENGETHDSVVVATEEVVNDDKTDIVTNVGPDSELVSETQDVGEQVSEEDQPLDNVRPEVIVIHGIATVDDSPFSTLVQEELESIFRFITSKEHMKNNIANIDFNYLSSQHCQGGKFRHRVGLQLSVRTANLWETPRSYVFRHAGQDSWHRANGSIIGINRIHQK